MLDNFEASQSDVQSEVSSAPQEPTASASEAASQQGSLEANKQTETSNVPFHEHPRFKELVEQKNKALETQKAYEARIAQMEEQFKKFSSVNEAKTQEDALIARLKGIDPEFGSRIEMLNNKLSQVDALQQKLEQYETAQMREKAVSMVNKLHTDNKVPEAFRQLYNDALDAKAMRGELKSLNDIPTAYKQLHDQYSKVLEDMRRSDRESYAKAKQADSKLPASTSKGKTVSPSSKPSFSKDREEAKAELVSRYLKMSKASSDI